MTENFLLLLVAIFLVFIYFSILYISYVKQKRKAIFRDRLLLKNLSELAEKVNVRERREKMAEGRILVVIKTRQVYFAPRGRLLSEIYIKYLLKENVNEEFLNLLLSCVSAHDNAGAWKRDNDVLIKVTIKDYDVYKGTLTLLLKKGKFRVLEESKGEALETEIKYGGVRIF